MNEINRNKKYESTCVHDMDVHKSLETLGNRL